MTIREAQREAWDIAEEKGFHAGRSASGRSDTLVRLCLVMTEVSEAAQEVKRNWWEGAPPSPSSIAKFGEELADTVIRLFDLAESVGVDLESAICQKMAKNLARPHKYGTAEEMKAP